MLTNSMKSLNIIATITWTIAECGLKIIQLQYITILCQFNIMNHQTSIMLIFKIRYYIKKVLLALWALFAQKEFVKKYLTNN